MNFCSKNVICDFVRSVVVMALVFGTGVSPDFGLAKSTSQLVVKDAWIPEAPPVSKVHAGYMTLINKEKSSISLVGAKSAQYGKVELHEMKHHGGHMTMKEIKQVDIPAAGTVKFSSHGMHLMLMSPKSPLKSGAKVEVILRLSNGSEQAVTFAVKKR